MPTNFTTSSMPFSASVALSAFSDEKAMARPVLMSRPLAEQRAQLVLGRHHGDLAPASWKAFRIVSARMKRTSFIITSTPASRS